MLRARIDPKALTHPNPAESISFDEALAIEGGERRYIAHVHPSWDGPLTTHGGLQAALALLAIDREIGAGAEILQSHFLDQSARRDRTIRGRPAEETRDRRRLVGQDVPVREKEVGFRASKHHNPDIGIAFERGNQFQQLADCIQINQADRWITEGCCPPA